MLIWSLVSSAVRSAESGCFRVVMSVSCLNALRYGKLSGPTSGRELRRFVSRIGEVGESVEGVVAVGRAMRAERDNLLG